MLLGSLKIAWRTILKQKTYSSILIGGFALGIAVCLLISLYIWNELNYDGHIQDGDRVYRIVNERLNQENPTISCFHSAPLAQTLVNDYPEIESAGRINAIKLFGAGSRYIRSIESGENQFLDGFVWADNGILNVLSIPFARGDASTALQDPQTMVISEQMAQRLFPNTDPIGQVVILDNDGSKPFLIEGVMRDLPQRSHIQFDFLLSLAGEPFFPGERTRWDVQGYFTYVKLREGVDLADVETKIQSVIENHYLVKVGGSYRQKIKDTYSFRLQAVRDIHLGSSQMFDELNHGDMRFVWLFALISVFILGIACVNFINLTTARSATRAREVGVRKVVGSGRGSLIRQFLLESLLLSFLSFALALILMELILPVFSNALGKPLSFPWLDWRVFPVVIFLAIAVGLIAGVFPAFYLSQHKPIDVLKGRLSIGNRSTGMRNFLVIFQFFICFVLLIGTLVVNRQKDFLLNTKLGYDKDQVVVINGTELLGERVESFQSELEQLAGVESATVSSYIPVAEGERNGNGFWREGRIGVSDAYASGENWQVDEDYLRTMGIKLVEGRDFLDEMSTDANAAIINEAMAKKLGLFKPIGARITNTGDIWTVIGVVEDFHFDTMDQEIRPLCLNLGNAPNKVSIRVNAGEMGGLMQSIENVWVRYASGEPIRITFMDESYAKMYDDVNRMGNILAALSLFAIFVACLGLYALSAFLTEQRSKEISVRRIVGASLQSIIKLLTLDFMSLIFWSFLFAAPLAWFLMREWLNSFVYRVEIGWDVFLLSAVLVLSISIATVSMQCVRAALCEPVKGLRNE